MPFMLKLQVIYSRWCTCVKVLREANCNIFALKSFRQQCLWEKHLGITLLSNLLLSSSLDKLPLRYSILILILVPSLPSPFISSWIIDSKHLTFLQMDFYSLFSWAHIQDGRCFTLLTIPLVGYSGKQLDLEWIGQLPRNGFREGLQWATVCFSSQDPRVVCFLWEIESGIKSCPIKCKQ